MSESKLLTEAEAAKYLNVSRAKLGQMRRDLIGPPYLEIGGCIRYRVEALQAWVLDQERSAS